MGFDAQPTRLQNAYEIAGPAFEQNRGQVVPVRMFPELAGRIGYKLCVSGFLIAAAAGEHGFVRLAQTAPNTRKTRRIILWRGTPGAGALNARVTQGPSSVAFASSATVTPLQNDGVDVLPVYGTVLTANLPTATFSGTTDISEGGSIAPGFMYVFDLPPTQVLEFWNSTANAGFFWRLTYGEIDE